MIVLRKVSETASTITLGWDQISGAAGYRFIVDGKVSHTFDGTRTTVRVAKAAAKVTVEALSVKDSGVWLPGGGGPAGYGTKLPPWPSVYLNPPTQVLDVTPVSQGGLNEWYLTDISDRIIRFPAGATLAAWPYFTNIRRCIVDYNGAKVAGRHFGMKWDGHCSDLWVKGYEISGSRVQGVLLSTDMQNVWFDGTVRDNNPDFTMAGPRNHHAYYCGAGHRVENIVISGKVLRQRNGYAVQGYDDYGVSGAGFYDSVLASMSIEDSPGSSDPNYADDGVGLWVIQGGGLTVANTVGRRNKRQLAVAAGEDDYPQPQIKLVACADIGRTGSDCTWGTAGGVQGTAGMLVDIPGDPGYRLPYDTRTTGIGAM